MAMFSSELPLFQNSANIKHVLPEYYLVKEYITIPKVPFHQGVRLKHACVVFL